MQEPLRRRPSGGSPPPRWAAVLCTALVMPLAMGAAAAPSGASPEAPEPSPALRVLATWQVPEEPSVPTDVRWASDSSVYLAGALDGIYELALDGEELTPRRHAFPGAKALRDRQVGFDQIAVSEEYGAAAGWANRLVWRRWDRKTITTLKQFDVADDIDLAGDRLLLLGSPDVIDSDTREVRPGIVWVASLSKELEDARAVLVAADPEMTRFDNCNGMPLGAARFLPDGSFLVVPGFQPGAHLFDAAGRLVRTWTSAELGIDSDAECDDMGREERQQLLLEPYDRAALINRHRVVDDVLPLPEGPGLLVRWLGRDGKAHWRLKVLRAGGIDEYEVPFVGERSTDRLRGDVRGTRIVLLLSDQLGALRAGQQPARLIVAELPRLERAAR